MKNSKVSAKERNLIKGAIRRVFSRSDLRKLVVERSRIAHTDNSRPRVKKWSICEACRSVVPTYLIQVDHMTPIVPIDTTLEQMSWDDLVDRIWCDISNLQPICTDCHKEKTKLEQKARRAHKKGQK
jgi:5-methylcytosine-specific restriction endonuclease McrA